jgi:hypothetical protein
MAERVAPCGFRCDLCAAFEGNAIDPVRISAAWSTLWRVELAPSQARCRGCDVAAEPGAALPEPGCPVRACATGRNLPGCVSCPECPCGELDRRLRAVEAVAARWRTRLSPAAYATFVAPYDARARLSPARPCPSPEEPAAPTPASATPFPR